MYILVSGGVSDLDPMPDKVLVARGGKSGDHGDHGPAIFFQVFRKFFGCTWEKLKKLQKWIRLRMILFTHRAISLFFVDCMSNKWICVQFICSKLTDLHQFRRFAINIKRTFSAKKFWFKSGPAKFFAFSSSAYTVCSCYAIYQQNKCGLSPQLIFTPYCLI